MGKLPPQLSPRPGCSDESAPICDSSCCSTTASTQPNKKGKIRSHKKDLAATTFTPEDEAEIKDLLLIGAGCHGHAIMLRLLEPDPDFLSDKERHVRGESTDRLRPIEDVTQHIKNLSRGHRATLRSKRKKKSKTKNQEGACTSPDLPPPLNLKEVQKSVLVVDTNGGWMQAWKDNFESLRIPKLRSLMNAHTDPYDHRSLEYYAEAKGRGDELVTLASLQKEKNFKGPYQVPSTSVFNSFHDLLSKAYGIEDIVHTGTVLSINPTQEDEKADEPIFEVQIAFGKQKSNVRTVKTRRIVCSMGPIFRALEPRWLQGLAPEASERVLHAHQICPYLKRRSEGNNNTNGMSKKKILIVGGGLTSAQLALLATESNWCSEVTLIQRSKMNPRHFDIGNEWMGPKRGKLLEDFWCMDINERVKKLKETRGGGTIPPEVILELAAKQGKKLEVKEEVEVTNVHWMDDRLQVFFDDGSEPDFYDMIWLATGAQNHIDHYSALSHLRKELPVDVVNGFPVLNTDLSWRAPMVKDGEEGLGNDEPTWKQVARKRIWFTGALAAVQLGPDALNLVGARHGSVLVARAIRQDIAQSKAAANLKEDDDHDCGCSHC